MSSYHCRFTDKDRGRELVFYDVVDRMLTNHHHGGTLADLQRINIPATQQNFVSRESDIFKQHQAEVMVKTFIPLEYIEMPNITPIRKIYDEDLPF